MLFDLIRTNPDWVTTVVRIVLGVVFFAHGQKLLGWYGGPGFTNTIGMFTSHLRIPVPVASLVILAEFLGGIGLILGLLSRLAAIGVLATMAGAVITVHGRNGLFMNWLGDKKGHGFEYHLLATTLALVVLINGAGALSVDGALYHHELVEGVTASHTVR